MKNGNKNKSSGGSIGYLTKEGFRNLRVNKLMTIASVTVLFSSMFLMGIAFMLYRNIEAIVTDIEQENVILVYIDDNSSSVETVNLKSDIMAIENVATCDFIPKDEAYESILRDMGEVSDYLRDLGENPLPDAYRVTVRDMSRFTQTVEQIKGLNNVMRTRENSDLAGKLASAKQAVTYVSLVIIALLFIVSLFIISNTVKITMFSRRLEISIMKSVGATNRFIRWPFIVEGVLIGIISGVLSTLAIWGVYVLGIRYLTAAVGIAGKGVDIKEYLPLLLGAFLILGIFTGIFGSASSIRKYLKERKFVELEDL